MKRKYLRQEYATSELAKAQLLKEWKECKECNGTLCWECVGATYPCFFEKRGAKWIIPRVECQKLAELREKAKTKEEAKKIANAETELEYRKLKKECENCTGESCRHNNFYSKKYVVGLETKKGVKVIRFEECLKAEMAVSRRKYEENLKRSGLPKRYESKTLRDYEEDETNRRAVKYAKVSTRLNIGAYIYGKTGVGKTYLATLIGKEWLQAGKSVRYEKVPKLLDEIRLTYEKGSLQGAEALIYKRLSEVDLLILDDIGQEKPTQFVGSTLCKIIDDRYEKEKATVITSNYSHEELEERLNNAVDGKNENGSRLIDRCAETIQEIEIKGESRRRRK